MVNPRPHVNMSTQFNENKHPRDGGGRFTHKTYTEADGVEIVDDTPPTVDYNQIARLYKFDDTTAPGLRQAWSDRYSGPLNREQLNEIDMVYKGKLPPWHVMTTDLDREYHLNEIAMSERFAKETRAKRQRLTSNATRLEEALMSGAHVGNNVSITDEQGTITGSEIYAIRHRREMARKALEKAPIDVYEARLNEFRAIDDTTVATMIRLSEHTHEYSRAREEDEIAHAWLDKARSEQWRDGWPGSIDGLPERPEND